MTHHPLPQPTLNDPGIVAAAHSVHAAQEGGYERNLETLLMLNGSLFAEAVLRVSALADSLERDGIPAADRHEEACGGGASPQDGTAVASLVRGTLVGDTEGGTP